MATDPTRPSTGRTDLMLNTPAFLRFSRDRREQGGNITHMSIYVSCGLRSIAAQIHYQRTLGLGKIRCGLRSIAEDHEHSSVTAAQFRRQGDVWAQGAFLHHSSDTRWGPLVVATALSPIPCHPRVCGGLMRRKLKCCEAQLGLKWWFLKHHQLQRGRFRRLAD